MAENNIQLDVVDLEDDRPLAVRRKRRMSTGLVDPAHVVVVQKIEEDVQQPMPAVKTPTKPKKRVRFSQPGPETSSASLSTGLTPHLKRTSFSSRERGSSTPQPLNVAPRSFSLPPKLSVSLPSPSLSPSPGPLSGEIQFEPLRQILDPRMKRRLRRNGLSEEVNNIEANQKEQSKWEQEIRDLKDQLALAKQSGREEHSDSGKEDETNVERVRELEQQIADIKELTDETNAKLADKNLGPGREASSEIDIFIDNNDDDFTAPTGGENEDPASNTTPTDDPTAVSEAGTQASLPHPAQIETLREARLSLEYLFPGEITLGLVPEDPKPLLDVMLERIRELKADLLLAEGSLSATQAQESNLRNQFNAVLGQLDRARDYAEIIRTTNRNEKSRADTAQARVETLRSTGQAAADKIEEMEKDADEKERSIQKLQDALETYRVEVGKLESLIGRMEGDHEVALSGLRAEMDEAVADLECHVVAETRGRREAEQEVEERNQKIKQLERQEEELKNALNEKQRIIRENEKIFEEERVGREREAGGLNVRIGQLTTELSRSDAKIHKAEKKERSLMRKLQEERDAGLRAVEAVQAELARCKEKAEEVKISYVTDVQTRGAEVTQHQGLLTPICATRFKDVQKVGEDHVEGQVEVQRGKGKGKKRDSGIVILEEDEDVIMTDNV